MIILDFGSGETCKNDVAYAKRMIDELKEVDSGKHQVVIKWQLFQAETVPYVEGLAMWVFDEAYRYAASVGYETTASVFDAFSLRKLLDYNVPFVKLACREWCYPLLGLPCMMGVNAIVSVRDQASMTPFRVQWGAETMCCVPKYPAWPVHYTRGFDDLSLACGISDHSEDWGLYNTHRPDIYECHYKLEDSTGPDAASFARTPKQLREIL